MTFDLSNIDRDMYVIQEPFKIIVEPHKIADVDRIKNEVKGLHYEQKVKDDAKKNTQYNVSTFNFNIWVTW